MAVGPEQVRERVVAWLARVSPRRSFRIGIAALLCSLHLIAFYAAGDSRLSVPFNSAPGETPYFSDPDAPAVRGYPRQPHYWSRLVVSRWDAQIYIGYAVRGLTSCPDEAPAGVPGDNAYLQCGLGWMPAYGLAGGLITDTVGVPPDFALLVLAWIAALVLNFLWTSRLIVERIGRFEAYATLLAFNVYPAAFYIMAPYTEGSTLALALGGFICLARDRWIAAGLLIGASTALRAGAVSFALALCCAAAVAAWQRRHAGDPRWWRPLLAIPLSGWGQLVTLLLLQMFVGDWSAYLRARVMFGDQRDWSRLVDPEFYLRGFTAQHMDSVMFVGAVALVLLVGRDVLRKFKREQAVFLVVSSVAVVLLSIPALHEYWGLNRYLLGCPLLFLCVACAARTHRALIILWTLLCLALYWHVELCSYVAQGNGELCPCLGRLEYWMPW